MNYELSEWLNLIVRWFHVFAGILWIGQTFLFTWMDRTFDREESLWLVHSGGFYIVERQKVPKDLPQTLHWFRWEAALTWLSGATLLITLIMSLNVGKIRREWVSGGLSTSQCCPFM